MAKLQGPFGFNGNLKGLSAYTMKGCEGIILRTSYGPSKEDIKTKPSYDITRRNNKEFGGRSTASKWIRRALHPLKPLLDHNLSGQLNALLKPVQEMDKNSRFGERHVLLSLAPHLLEGLNFNGRHPFDSVVRNAVDGTLSRELLSARVNFPALLPSLTFFAPGPYSYYRLMAVLGVVPDLFYAQPTYRPRGNYDPFFSQTMHTEWYAVKSGSPALNLQLHLPSAPPGSDFSLMLSVGVQMGSVEAGGNITGIPYTGSGKILAMR